MGGKYEHIQELYQLYLTQAKQEMRKEWSLFKHIDNDKQNENHNDNLNLNHI